VVWLGARLKGLNCEIIASIEVVASHFTDRFFESATGTSLGDPNKQALIILHIFMLYNVKLLTLACGGK
jgi:hypothetical protein